MTGNLKAAIRELWLTDLRYRAKYPDYEFDCAVVNNSWLDHYKGVLGDILACIPYDRVAVIEEHTPLRFVHQTNESALISIAKDGIKPSSAEDCCWGSGVYCWNLRYPQLVKFGFKWDSAVVGTWNGPWLHCIDFEDGNKPIGECLIMTKDAVKVSNVFKNQEDFKKYCDTITPFSITELFEFFGVFDEIIHYSDLYSNVAPDIDFMGHVLDRRNSRHMPQETSIELAKSNKF